MSLTLSFIFFSPKFSYDFRAGQLSTEIALHILEYLKKELEYVPWAAAQRQLSYIDGMLSKTELYGQFVVGTPSNFLIPLIDKHHAQGTFPPVPLPKNLGLFQGRYVPLFVLQGTITLKALSSRRRRSTCSITFAAKIRISISC